MPQVPKAIDRYLFLPLRQRSRGIRWIRCNALMMSSFKTIAALVLVNLLFGTGYPLLKSILHYLPPDTWIFVRSVGYTVLLVLFLWRSFWKQSLTAGLLAKISLCALLGLVVNQICFAEGLYRTIPAHAAVMNATIPLQTLIFSRLINGEIINRYKMAGIVLGMLGVFILLNLDWRFLSNPFLNGDLLIFINASSYALFLTLAGKWLSSMGAFVALTWMSLLATVPIGFYAHWKFPLQAITHFPLQIILFMLFLIVLQSIVTYGLNIWALKRVPASQAALYVYLQPVAALLLGYYLLGDEPSTRFYVSSGFIFMGILLGSR